MVRELHLKMYPVTVLLMTDYEEVRRFHEHFGIEFEEYGGAFVAPFEIPGAGRFLLLGFRNYENALKDSILVHEIVHMKNFIMEFTGVLHDFENDEPEAYLTMYLYELLKHVIRHGDAEEIHLNSALPEIIKGTAKSDSV